MGRGIGGKIVQAGNLNDLESLQLFPVGISALAILPDRKDMGIAFEAGGDVAADA
jgi:hypothetical protein